MNKSHFKIMVTFALTYLIANMFALNNVLYIFSFIIFVAGIKSPVLGFSLWLISLPLGTYTNNLIFHMNLGLLNIALLFKLTSMKIRFSRNLLLFIFSFIMSMLLSILVNSDINASSYLLTLNSFGMFTLVALLLSSQKNENLIDYIVLSLTIAAITMAIFIFRDFDSMIRYNRLAFGDNVRSLANSLGLPILLLSAFIIDETQINISILNKRVAFLMLTVFTGLLILSASRGVIFSLVIALSFYVLTNFNVKILKSLILWFIPSGIIVYFILSNHDLISKFSIDRILVFTSNNRTLIWSSTLRGFLDNIFFRILFGTGVENFSSIATHYYGKTVYAHSVFFDTLVSLGVTGFVILVLFLISIGMNCIQSRSKLTTLILIYTVVSFLGHGTVHHVVFWINITIVYTLNSIKLIRNSNELY